MALIKCPECGREVSNTAKACPGCGAPISELTAPGTVRIKLPNIELGLVGLFSSRATTIYNTNNNSIIWEGRHGETAVFEVNEPTEITIDMGGWVNNFNGTVVPRKRYTCIQDMGAHMFATYTLTEVDMIDSE